MRARLDERAGPEPERPRRAAPPLPAILALQQGAGNAAVARALTAARQGRMLQRELRVTDTKQTFTDAPSAAGYLTTEYKAAYKIEPTVKVRERLRELASAAASTDKVVEVTLKPALLYAHDGTPLRPEIYEREPWKSPSRDPAPAWNFDLTHRDPAPLFAPQSPRHEYPSTDYDPMSVDVRDDLRDERGRVEGERSSRKGKDALGKNMVTYKVRAHLRIEQMRSVDDADGSRRYTADRRHHPIYDSAHVDSDVYQSKFKKLGPRPRARKRDMQDSMRSELDLIRSKYADNPDFSGGSSLYSDDVDRGRGYFKNKTRAKSQAISSLYVHSEVQAAADAHDGAGRALARDLMDDIETRLRERKQKNASLRAVVVAVTFSGHSDPNTVCSGACKGALMHIGEILETEFAAARAAEKERLRRASIFLRGSAFLRVSGHFTASERFQGYELGAGRAPRDGRLPSSRVYEYRPSQ